MTRASVLIPIHDKPTTLPLTVDTVLRQSMPDLEVLLIGDGITDEVRAVVEDLVAGDERVRFLDRPKGPHHGERYRHDAIEAARSDAIFYLCDDDLLLPDHVADLLELLQDHDLVQCLNGCLTPDGRVRLYAADLSDAEVVDLHLREDLAANSISITGTAHTRSAYERVSRWDTTPAGWWPDHWQFRKMLGPGFRAATSARMTALQFPTSADGRDTWTDRERSDEVGPWHDLVTSPGAQEEVDRRVRAGMLPQLVEERGRLAQLRGQLAQLDAALASSRIEQARLSTDEAFYLDLIAERGDALTALRDDVDALRGHVDHLRGHVERLVEIRTSHETRLASLRDKVASKDETIARLRAKLRAHPAPGG